MKGGNVDQLYMLSKEISQTFQSTSNHKKEELEEQVRKLKEPIDDYRLMINAALDACMRRRHLAFKYYELVDQHKKSNQSIGGHDLDNSGSMRS